MDCTTCAHPVEREILSKTTWIMKLMRIGQADRAIGKSAIHQPALGNHTTKWNLSASPRSQKDCKTGSYSCIPWLRDEHRCRASKAGPGSEYAVMRKAHPRKIYIPHRNGWVTSSREQVTSFTESHESSWIRGYEHHVRLLNHRTTRELGCADRGFSKWGPSRGDTAHGPAPWCRLLE